MKLTDAPPATQSINTLESSPSCAALTACRRVTVHEMSVMARMARQHGTGPRPRQGDTGLHCVAERAKCATPHGPLLALGFDKHMAPRKDLSIQTSLASRIWVLASGRSAIVAGLLALGATGCGDGDAAEAEINLTIWRSKGPSSYTYVVSHSCFCSGVEPVRIVVENEVAIRATGMDTGAPLEDRRRTMTELLGEVLELIGEKPDDFSAEYHPELGYLLEAQIDRIENAADDELEIEVSCFEQDTGDAACPIPTLATCSGEARAADVDEPVQRTCLGWDQPEGQLAGSDLLCCPAPTMLVTTAACEARGASVITDAERTPSCFAPEVGRNVDFLGVVTDSASEAVCCANARY